MDMVSVEFRDQSRKRTVDVQIPLFLTGEELVKALTHAYDLPLDLNDPTQAYMRAERPIALIAGKQTLEELGIMTGSIIIFER